MLKPGSKCDELSGPEELKVPALAGRGWGGTNKKEDL